MKDSGWERFVNTGQVCDYLSYKGHKNMDVLKNQSGNTEKSEYAGFCSINRDSNKSRTNR